MLKVGLVIVLAALNSQALAVRVDVEKQASSGCKVVVSKDPAKVGELKATKFMWGGTCKAGYLEGEGTLVETGPNGSITRTTATFRHGREEGPGSADATLADGTRASFRGSFFRGLPQTGDLTVEASNGGATRYRGPFVEGIPDGQGRIEFGNKAVFEGEIRGLRPNGQGKLSFPSGVSVTGNFRDGQRPSSGHVEFPNGSSYDGELKDLKPHGKGTSVAADRTRYSGEFVDGKAEGSGTIQQADGNSYNVQIRDGNVQRLPGREELAEAARVERARVAAEHQRAEDQQRYENAVIACRSRAAYSVSPAAGNLGEMLARAGQCNLDPEAFRTPQVVVVPSQPSSISCIRTGPFVNCNMR